jgi:hypothetical protein
VADQDVGHAGLVTDVGEQVQHLRLDGHVQRGDGLIQDQDPWLGCQRAGDRHPLPLPAGQRSRHRPRLALIQADQAGELGDPRPAAVGRPAVVQPEHLIDGSLGGLPRVQAGVRVLEHDLHLAPAAPPVRARPGGPGPVLPAGGDRPAGRPFQAHDHPRDRGLARAGLAHDR